MSRPSSFIVPAIMVGILLIGSFIILFFAGTPIHEESIDVAVVLKTIDSNMEFWEVVKNGMRSAVKETGVHMEIFGPWTESDIEGQIIIMEKVVKSRPTVIVLSATDHNALTPLVEEAHALGIPVVTLDSGINSDIPVTFVATNNIEAAEKLGTYCTTIVPPGTPVAIINHVPGATTAIEREEGVRHILEKDGRYPIVGTWFTNNFEQNAYAITRELITSYPDLGCILAMNEVSTIGAAKALKDLGCKDKVKLLGFDNSLPEIQFMEEGILQATIIQKPFNMGYLSIRAALDAVQGKSLPRFIDTGSALITPENMYSPENQKLLFPFIE
ncbi:MAG TPA: substrate-binding domain-containing protein [Spirochaetales bacterium]|nr:substrate-binding domain-containing protein [Spirochaetales bacterium]